MLDGTAEQSGDASQLTTADHPLALSEGELRIEAQLTKVREAYQSSLHSLFNLGDELNNLSKVIEDVEGTKPTRAQLAKKLKISHLSEARISQLMLTAETFPKNLREDGIDFKAYEVARELDAKSIVKRDINELSNLVKESKSSAKVRAAITKTDAIIALGVRRKPNNELEAVMQRNGTDQQQLAIFVAIAYLENILAAELSNDIDSLRKMVSEVGGVGAYSNGFADPISGVYKLRIAQRLSRMIRNFRPSNTLKESPIKEAAIEEAKALVSKALGGTADLSPLQYEELSFAAEEESESEELASSSESESEVK